MKLDLEKCLSPEVSAKLEEKARHLAEIRGVDGMEAERICADLFLGAAIATPEVKEK